MFCSKCGELITPEANFCSNCGLPVYRIDAPAVNAVGAGGAPVYLSGTPGAQTRFSGIAITAFVFVFFIPLVGLILGYVARRQIRTSRGLLRGFGLATATVILGWIWILLGLVFWLAVLSSPAFWDAFYSNL